MQADVVIVGGGVMGCSIAYHLRQDGFRGRVVVVERDARYARASSQLAMGGIRQQFSSAVNIRLVQASLPFWRTFDERMCGDGPPAWFRPRGYLFLVTAEMAPVFERRLVLQRDLGANVERLSVEQIAARVPDLALEDIVYGVLGPDDGYANPPAVLTGMRAGAHAAGAEFIEADVQAVERSADCVTGVRIAGGERIDAPLVINAAGANAARVGAMAGLELPIQPVRQHLFRCALPEPWPYRFPMVIDPTGVHWRHDDPTDASPLDRIVVARTKTDEPAGENFACDESRWTEDFLPPLQRRVPRFERLRLLEGWAGLYDMTPDHNPLIGSFPELEGFWIAAGFSGHGLMMSPAIGRAVSEMVRTGASKSVDITPLKADRFARGEPFYDEAML